MWRGTMLLVSPAKPRNSASLIALRSTAVLAASRTRRSAHGDFASHWSRKSRKKTALLRWALILNPGLRRSCSATGPLNV